MHTLPVIWRIEEFSLSINGLQVHESHLWNFEMSKEQFCMSSRGHPWKSLQH